MRSERRTAGATPLPGPAGCPRRLIMHVSLLRFGCGSLLASLILLGGCAMVEVRTLAPADYVAQQRGDILSTGALSQHTREALQVIGMTADHCSALNTVCIDAIRHAPGLADERRLAALTELWMQQALGHTPEPSELRPDPRLHAWFETARHAYAYLFFTQRQPGQRAFEDRQIQILDYSSYATEAAVGALFAFQNQRRQAGDTPLQIAQRVAGSGWSIQPNLSALMGPYVRSLPQALVPASALGFDGLRSTYRRDGFGAEMVAVFAEPPLAMARTPDAAQAQPLPQPFSPMSTPVVTLVLSFPGDTLDDVLTTRQVQLTAHDPYRESHITLHGEAVPLAGNFTAGYGLWLARSGFSRQSLRTLLGRGDGIARPHIYLMQPYDPNRRVLVMVHGLASSPEAWVNLANEVLGDEVLRQNFQIWQVYYPTNVPVTINRAAIQQALHTTFQALDPQGRAAASCDMVLIGHSMGGLLSRLLTSYSGDALWLAFADQNPGDAETLDALRAPLEPMLRFAPTPGVGRVIFLAAPHRGTLVAGLPIVQRLTQLIQLPIRLFEGFDDVVRLALRQPGAQERLRNLATGVDHLNADHPFVKLAAHLPMQPGLPYHSIIARTDPAVAAPDSNDGLVPYWSSHLPGAQSEILVTSGHSVQETPEAILEIRRILHHDLRQRAAASTAGLSCASTPASPN